MAVKATGNVWNTRTFQSRQADLEQAHAAVKAQELVMLRFMERSAVHLSLKGVGCPRFARVLCVYSLFICVVQLRVVRRIRHLCICAFGALPCVAESA